MGRKGGPLKYSFWWYEVAHMEYPNMNGARVEKDDGPKFQKYLIAEYSY